MTNRPIVNPRLGAAIRDEREQAGLSLRELADRCGVHYSAIAKIEQGQVASPDPAKLRAIARVLKMDVRDLYALSGYAVPDGLPGFAPYLRSKYELPDDAISELERYFEDLKARYGFEEGDDESPR
jgi:transcriptional regulator with XRE-family HTH domain